MRLLWALIVVAMLTVLMATLLVGDGTASGGTVLKVTGTHGINRNDLPVVGVWAVGVISTAWLYVRGRRPSRGGPHPSADV